MKRFGMAGSVACVLLGGSPFALAEIRHAGPTATGLGDCSDWNNVCTLTNAISAAAPGDEVWVKAGTHDDPITLKSGVRIIGGFAGDETAASDSNPGTHATIIDGTQANRAVVSNGNDAATQLRGFRITGGWDSSGFVDVQGGGGASVVGSNATFVDCEFYGNWALTFGGAVIVKGTGSPKFINCTFHDNGLDDTDPDPDNHVRVHAGGAVFIDGGTPRFTNCLFHHNLAMEGGAVAVSSGAPVFVNCTVADNDANIGYGGGMYDPVALATVTNSVFWGNAAVRGSNQLGAHPGLTIAVSYSDIQGGYSGMNNINAVPQFEGGATEYGILASSPCRDTGDDDALPSDVANLDWDSDTGETLPLDLAGLWRVAGTGVDVGAYEYSDCTSNADCTGGELCCTGLCQPCCDDADCADGLFCNGVETCSSGACQAGSYPCAAWPRCSEIYDFCGCAIDPECSDGLFCNGPEVCVNGSCEAGTDPCPGQFCDEVAKVCVWCNQDSDCQTGEKCCSGNCQECCNNMDCPGMLNLCCPTQGFVCSTTCPQ